MFEKYEEYHELSMEKPCFFNANIYRSPKNCSNNTNWHSNIELQYCSSGKGYVLIDGEKFEFQEGDVVVVNSKSIHYTDTLDELKYHCLIISTQLCELASIEYEQLFFQPVINNPIITDAIKDITKVYYSDDECKTAILQMLLLKILIELKKNHTIPNKFVNKSSNNHIIINTIKYIKKNYSNKLTLDILAKNAFTDKYSLSKKFKSTTGYTIVQYINSYRCEKVIELKRKGISINEAAIKCGFNNMSFFTKTFKAFTGELPSQYRKKL
jgi:YesN/AraC family two-component response regulator